MENVPQFICRFSFVRELRPRSSLPPEKNMTIDGIALRNLLPGETPRIHLSVHRHIRVIVAEEILCHQIWRSQLAYACLS